MDYYFSQLGQFGFELAKAVNKTGKKPNTRLDNIDQYVDGDILMKPKGIVF